MSCFRPPNLTADCHTSLLQVASVLEAIANTHSYCQPEQADCAFLWKKPIRSTKIHPS
ncbi:MAG: hypothetical protein AAF268_15330 [Cyanobacteria bacterium P01_A01_bin.3]